jgi:hypothetical protein
MLVVGALVVVAIAVGVGVATRGDSTTTPPVANQANPVKPPVVDPVKPPENPNAVATSVALAIKNESARGRLRGALSSWDKGELEPALIELSTVEQDTDSYAEAQKLRADIQSVKEAMAAGEAAFRRGDCGAALKSYQAAAKVNARVPAVNAGIAKCKAAAIPENVE